MTKYRKRSDWSHKDLLKIAHVKPENKGKLITITALEWECYFIVLLYPHSNKK